MMSLEAIFGNFYNYLNRTESLSSYINLRNFQWTRHSLVQFSDFLQVAIYIGRQWNCETFAYFFRIAS